MQRLRRGEECRAHRTLSAVGESWLTMPRADIGGGKGFRARYDSLPFSLLRIDVGES